MAEIAPELENLALFYRSLTTEQLQTYRAALTADLETAQRAPRRARHTAAFRRSRIDAITRILGERGVIEREDRP